MNVNFVSSSLRVVVACVLLTALTALSACGSVAVPTDHWFRLQAPTTPPAGVPPLDAPRAGILRVLRPTLAATVAPDRLMRSEGPVRMQPYEFLRWSGPLDEMVADTFVTAASRAKYFASVKNAGDPGAEDLQLATRVVEFHHVVDGDTWNARVVVELRLTAPSDGTLFFHEEFAVDVPITGRDADDVVVGLSQGICRVATLALQRARDEGALGAVAAGPAGR